MKEKLLFINFIYEERNAQTFVYARHILVLIYRIYSNSSTYSNISACDFFQDQKTKEQPPIEGQPPIVAA